MKRVIGISILAAFPLLVALTLFAACENPLVSNILPDRDGITYTVTFNKNGGDSDADPKTKIVRPPATTIDKMPEKPIWAGRTFIRWTANADGSGAVFTTATPVTADITVYAQWLEVPEGSFVVTFDSNGGDTDADPAAKVVTPPATNVGTLPAPPTWANHTFAGWNTQADGLGTAFTASTTVNANITVYAKWTQGVTPPPTPPVVVDFESDSIGKTYIALSGADSQVVTDPANAGQKSLQITSSNYNQAAVIPITLPAALNTAESFTFRFNLTNGAISYKKILVYISGDAATFVDGAFGNAANNPDHYPEFAANKLGETEEFNDPTINEWLDFEITIGSLSATIRDLTGDVYLAIGINHGTNEGITYLLDDLTFTFGAPKPPPVSDIVDFENDALGKTYEFTYGDDEPTSVKVVADPLNAGQKSLEIVSNNYNQAAVVPINLSKALNLFKSFTFRFNLKNGTLNDKDMMVYVADSIDTFKRYSFGNPSTDSNNFAANLLGSVSLENVNNEWGPYIIAIENPGNAIRTLSGDVFLAIGINHSNTEGVTYLLDDITFSVVEPPPPAAFPTLVTFESDNMGKTYQSTRGNNSPEVTVHTDPASSALSAQSLRIITNGGSDGTSGYNQAAVIPINLPDGNLSAYKSLRFKFYFTGGALLDPQNQHRKINAYISDSTGTFIQYGFGNPSGNQYQFAANLLGEVEPDYGETNSWVDYAINFTAGSTISGLSGNVYVAIGINHDKAATYYLDNITFSKQELIKNDGGALGGTLTVASFTHKSAVITAGSVTAPATGQTIEYSVSPTVAGEPGVWQDSTSFDGLSASTSYTAYARAKQNAQYAAGPVTSSAPFTTGSKSAGATLSGSISTTELTHNKIVIGTITKPANQEVEYAISTGTTAPGSGWHASTTFSGLARNTDYYVFARAKENEDYNVGTAISGGPFKTTAGPPTNPSVPAVVVNFEDDALGSTTKYSVTTAPNNGTGTVTIVADPSNAGQKSLNMYSTGYNIGAVVPIHLPFALEKYQSFTFRFRLATGTPSNPNVSVYIADAANKFTQYGFGNPSNNANQFANLLLGEVEPNYSVDQWVEYEIEIDANSLNSTIKTMSGNLHLAIGINSNTTIDLQFDDLTFNAVHDFKPPPSLSPTSATFVLANQAPIPVTMNLYGSTLDSIKNGGTSLVLNTDYSVSGNIATLNTSYFTGMTDGTTVTLTFVSSNGASSNFVVTIRAAALLIAHDFTTNPNVAVGTQGTGINTTIADGVLKVNKTSGYTGGGPHPAVVIPFDLGSTNLSNYTKLVIVLKGSGDTGNKTLLVEYQPSSTPVADPGSNPTFGTQGTSGSGFGSSFATFTINKSGSPSATGQIKIVLSLGNTNPYVLEIQSIRFE